MAIENINIDFEVIRTGNPNTLIICDTSTWAHIKDASAIIEICLPTNKIITHSHIKEKNSVFNSSNLYLSSTNTYTPLPDGLYTITIKGSPDTFQKKRTYIRTEKLRLETAEIYLSYGRNPNDIPEEVKKLSQDIDFLIDASEAAVRRDEKKQAIAFYKEAQRIFDDYNDCKNC